MRLLVILIAADGGGDVAPDAQSGGATVTSGQSPCSYGVRQTLTPQEVIVGFCEAVTVSWTRNVHVP